MDVRPGYFPTGKGHVVLRVPRVQGVIQPVNIAKIGRPDRVIITYYNKDNKLPGSSK